MNTILICFGFSRFWDIRYGGHHLRLLTHMSFDEMSHLINKWALYPGRGQAGGRLPSGPHALWVYHQALSMSLCDSAFVTGECLTPHSGGRTAATGQQLGPLPACLPLLSFLLCLLPLRRAYMYWYICFCCFLFFFASKPFDLYIIRRAKWLIE